MITERTLSFPFTVTSHGSVEATTDYRKIWQDRVAAAVGTSIGERPIDRADYGTLLAKTLWSNEDEVVEIASEQVPLAFAKHLPYLSLEGVEVYEVEQGGAGTEDTYLQIEITYILPNGDEVTSAAVVGSMDQTGEFSVYDAYSVPAYTDNNFTDIEVD